MSRRGESQPDSPPVDRTPSRPARIRCAVYTRKSTEEGLEQEFNSLDAQREACQAFVASQRSEGWTLVETRYDDGGYTGGNMDRPALRRLLADVEAGLVDVVLTYKVDRLSRSLLDFSRIIEVLDRRSVSFVSVTQQFNTTTSMGRLVLNVLLSFAQFEREIIADRTRDKISAARRKGRWTGGNPVLGYDVAPDGRRLVVNELEAERVREIFRIYVERGSLLEAIRELGRRGWTTKHRHSKRRDRPMGGRAFDKQKLYALLTNRIYLGQVEFKGSIYDGEHPAILDRSLWDETQEMLRTNGRGPRSEGRIRHETLLRGLLVCHSCAAPMSHHLTVTRGRRYRYYVCSRALKEGWDRCETKTLPVEEMDHFIVDQIREISQDRSLTREVVAEASSQSVERRATLERESEGLARELRVESTRFGDLAGKFGSSTGPVPEEVNRLLEEHRSRLDEIETRRAEIRAELDRLARESFGEEELAAAFQAFDPAWDSLTPTERSRTLHLLLERVVYDPTREAVSLSFRPSGIRALSRSEQLPGGAA
jgi:site-specific DNA recombinase